MLVEVASWILDSEKQGVRTGMLDISWSDCEGLIIPVMLDKVWAAGGIGGIDYGTAGRSTPFKKI
jgi:hypothetical protein